MCFDGGTLLCDAERKPASAAALLVYQMSETGDRKARQNEHPKPGGKHGAHCFERSYFVCSPRGHAQSANTDLSGVPGNLPSVRCIIGKRRAETSVTASI